MKNIYAILIVIFILNNYCFSQNTPKEIKVTDNKNVTLIFPSAIEQGIVGSKNFKFIFDISIESKIGILKGTKAKESNLMVITQDGNVYSFILKYVDNISYKDLTVFITSKEARGNINGERKKENILNETSKIEKQNNKIIIDNITENDFFEKKESFGVTENKSIKKVNNKLYNSNKKEFFEKTCGYLLNKKPYFSRYFARNDNIYLRLNNLIFSNNELYLILEIENKGIIDYDINFINLYVTTKSKNKRNSTQQIIHEPVYTFYVPEKVKSFKTSRFVLVYDKFSVSNKKIAVVNVSETRGERNISLDINKREINNPNSY